jgi:hypothetical protein
MANSGLNKRIENFIRNHTICDGCRSEVPNDEICDCACGLPFCLDCYDDHFWNCPQAIQVAGIMGWRKR